MKINRMLCIISIIGFGIFGTYYGGNISYALFYLSLLIPTFAFLYTLYVYFRFKLYQALTNYLVVKGDWTEYSFVIANEDYITFRNVRVNFLSDKSTIEATNQSNNYSLLPNESERMETRLRCNYRGTYYVGLDTIEITDFLYLFTITYPIRSKLKVEVLPRVVNIESLGIAPPQMDVKNPLGHSNYSEEELDTELRKYAPGDNKKRVHWKASARQQELLSRKYHHKPKAQIKLFMDLSKILAEELQVVIAEDKIIESILAIANYYGLRDTASEIIFDMDGRKQVMISSREEFQAFYKTCATIQFNAKQPISQMIEDSLRYDRDGHFYVVATHELTKELYLSVLQAVSKGNIICILYISDDVSESTKEVIDSLRLGGATVYQILSEDEIEKVLTSV